MRLRGSDRGGFFFEDASRTIRQAIGFVCRRYANSSGAIFLYPTVPRSIKWDAQE